MSDVKKDSDIIRDFLLIVRDGVVFSQRAKGLRASGKSASGLSIQFPKENVGQLTDPSGSFYYQEYGRGSTRPSAAKGSPTLQEIIYEWLRYKKYGLNWTTEKQRLGISWAITKKIHLFGTYTKIKGKPTGVITDIINDDSLDDLQKEFANKYGELIAETVVNVLLDKNISSDIV